MRTQAFDLGAIEHELQTARSQAGGSAAITMNLVVYVDDESLQSRADERAAHLADKYPARIIVLHTDEEPVKVSSAVRKSGDGSLVNAERIELGIADLSPQAICSAVNTLRVPDAPNILWWTSETVANDILFEDLITMMDTVIVDSSGAATEDFAIRELCEFFQQNRRYRLRDLAYMRLSPWQDMVAQFFDDSHFLEQLRKIERLEITAGSVAEAYYLVGWLASRLNWTPCGRLQLCDERERPIAVSLRHDGDPRRVIRIALGTDDTEFTAELSDTPDTVCLSVTGPQAGPPRCAPLHDIDNMSLLEKAFLLSNHDDVFEASLGVLHHLFSFTS